MTVIVVSGAALLANILDIVIVGVGTVQTRSSSILSPDTLFPMVIVVKTLWLGFILDDAVVDIESIFNRNVVLYYVFVRLSVIFSSTFQRTKRFPEK